MKTFTNLAHRAFKKCASLGTTNRNRYYLFSIIMLLTLGVGNAWGEEVTETITMKNFGGLTTGSLIYQTKPGTSDKGTGMVAFAFHPTTGQVRGNQTGIVGASVTTDHKSHNWSLYNSDPMAGVIKAIKVTQTATGTNKFQKKLYVSLGTSSQGEVTAVTNAQEQDAGGTAQEINFTIDPSKGYTYFKLLSNEKFTSGTVAGVIVTVTYETAGGSVTPDPEPDPTTYTIKWHTAKGVTKDVTLNEGATITKPATDPTMAGYKFMGWTTSCDVASDGSDFTAIEDFGTADSDKDFYAVFAVETTTGGGTEDKEFSFNITKADFNSTSYIANNNEKTSTATASDASTMEVKWTSNQVMLQSGVMQWQKNTGYIFNSTDLGTIKSVEITKTDGTFTTYYGTSEQPSSGATVGNGYFQIKIGGATGKSSNIKVTFTQTVEGGGTTTYSDYITTCASGVEYVELGDAFKWNATEAEVTIDATDNVFPTLTNTHNVPVTYSSSDDATASIASDGTVTLNKEGTVTITAKYAGGTSAGTGKEYKTKTVTYSLKVNKADPVASGTTYVKVTSTAGITDGEYLIVYETGKVAFNGALDALDVANNTLEVEINSNTIAGDQYIDKAIFTIDVTNGTILSASGKYIGKTANSNGLDVKTTAMTNTFAIDADGNAIITGNTAALRYNKTADQQRFRYYKDGGGTQEKIALYKKASSHTLTYGTCTNGSVSADVADGATVLSGTTITLSNSPITDYKLSAYDVYKTGEESTKVTVTDGKFIMPEFDVTISATFVPAKTLTSIEITSAATQTTFWQGETFNYTGLEVTAHFDGAADEDVTDKVTVTGSTATAGAAVEVTVSFTEGTTTKTTNYDITVKATANGKETAYDVATAREIIDKVSTADNVYVTGIVSEIVTPYNSEYGNITYNISADGLTTSNQLQAFRGKSYNGENFTSADDIQVGDEVVVFGNLLKYSSTYELNAGNQLVELKRDKQQPELSYTTTEYNVNLGDAFTAPTLNNPHTLAVTYSSNNEDVATVAADGAVTIKAAGTVKITASFAGNDDYVAGSASYTINITDPSISEATFVAGTDKSDTKSISKNGITVEFTDGSFSRSDNYRCYGGQSMTISYADGNITKIVFTCDGSSYGPDKFSTETVTYSYSGSVGTWVGDAKSVTFAASSQVRMTDITVYYKQDNRANAALAWSEETVSLTVGDAFTAPTFSNPNSLAVSFESSNTELATVDNAGAISLVSGKTGTATITATYAGNETYKPAEVTCVITVSPKTENVVILAQYAGNWYALKAEYVAEKTDRLAALPVEYINGTLYNVADADKALIEWQQVVEGNKVTFKNGDNYLKGKSSTTLILEPEVTGLYQWDYPSYTMVLEGSETVRTFLYSNTNNCFRNYDADLASNGVATDVAYSALPVVTAPVYATAIEIGGDDNSSVIEANKGQKVNVIVDRAFKASDEWYTLCVPFNMSASLIGTAYQLSGLVKKGADYVEVNLAAKTTIEAGKPYLVKPNVTVNKFVVKDVTIVNTTGESIAKSISGLSVEMQGVINGTGTTSGLYWVGNSGYLYNDDVDKSGLRTYFNITTSSGIAPRMRVVAGENVETGMEDIITTDAPVKVIENGQLIIIRDGVKYNVQGVRL